MTVTTFCRPTGSACAPTTRRRGQTERTSTGRASCRCFPPRARRCVSQARSCADRTRYGRSPSTSRRRGRTSPATTDAPGESTVPSIGRGSRRRPERCSSPASSLWAGSRRHGISTVFRILERRADSLRIGIYTIFLDTSRKATIGWAASRLLVLSPRIQSSSCPNIMPPSFLSDYPPPRAR